MSAADASFASAVGALWSTLTSPSGPMTGSFKWPRYDKQTDTDIVLRPIDHEAQGFSTERAWRDAPCLALAEL